MKIAYFISDLRTGGAQKQILSLIQQIKNENENLLLTWRGKEEDFYLPPKDVERFSIHDKSKNKYNIKETLAGIYKSRKKIHSFKPDVVISFLFEVNALAILSIIGLKKTRIVLSIREYPNSLNFGLKGRLYNFLAKRANVFVVQNDQIKQWVKSKYPQSDVEVIANYMILKPEIKTQPDDIFLKTLDCEFALAAGTKPYQKGFDLLIKSFKLARSEGVADHLVVLGILNSQERSELIDLANNLEIEEYVHVFGPVGNIDEWYKKAKYYVMSSRHEGIPNSLIEALYLGVPSISFDCPTGPKELLAGGALGELVPREDIRRLAEAIKKVSSSPDMRALWVEKLRKQDFDNTNEITKLWRNLL